MSFIQINTRLRKLRDDLNWLNTQGTLLILDLLGCAPDDAAGLEAELIKLRDARKHREVERGALHFLLGNLCN